jgi:hypothetical protein
MGPSHVGLLDAGTEETLNMDRAQIAHSILRKSGSVVRNVTLRLTPLSGNGNCSNYQRMYPHSF